VAGTAAAFKVLWCRWWEVLVWEKYRKMMEHESWFNVRRSNKINIDQQYSIIWHYNLSRIPRFGLFLG